MKNEITGDGMKKEIVTTEAKATVQSLTIICLISRFGLCACKSSECAEPCTQPHFQKGNNQGLTLYIAVPIEFEDEGPWGTAKADKGWYSWLEKLGAEGTVGSSGPGRLRSCRPPPISS